MSNPMTSPLLRELSDLLNKHSMESGSNTPDFILADYLTHCLNAFNYAVNQRDRWYQFKPLGHERS